MRILAQNSCRWSQDFIDFEAKLEKEFSNKIIEAFVNEEGTIRHMKRMTYREGKEIQSITIRATFLIYKGQWFKETVGFDIYTDECIDFISVRIGYGNNYKLFKKNDINAVANFIINKVNSQIVKKNINNDNKINQNRNIK